MRTVQEIFSRVQTDFNDITMDTFQRAEYIDAVRDIVDTISYSVEAYLNTYNVVPNPSSAPVSPDPQTVVVPNTQPISYIDRVERNGTPCFEFSRSAVVNNVNVFFPFDVNEVVLSSNAYASLRNRDDSTTLYFGVPFSLDETLSIQYFAHTQVSPIVWTTTTNIPQVLCNVVEIGIKRRLMERLLLQGKGNPNTMGYLNIEYQKALGTAKSDTRRLIDRRSFLQAQPLRFLSEN